MSKHTTKEDTLYYKSMRLTNAQLVVEVKEKTEFDPADVSIFHSPSKYENKFRIQLKNRQELREYIAMLQDFDYRFGNLLDEMQTPEKESDNE